MATGNSESTSAEVAHPTEKATKTDTSAVSLSSQDQSSLRTILTYALLTAEAENEDELSADIIHLLNHFSDS